MRDVKAPGRIGRISAYFGFEGNRFEAVQPTLFRLAGLSTIEPYIVCRTPPYAARMNLPLSQPWPNWIDLLTTAGFLALVIGIPALGYVFMVLDFRAYLRSLRRALVRMVNYFPELPEWVRQETPACVLALGLRMPCSEDDVKQAYREKVKQLHPDRGGDKRRFMQLQRQFEQALAYLASQRRPSDVDWSGAESTAG